MNINSFSKKQLTVIKWWNITEYKDCNGVICDGAVRSGKTLAMSLGFIFWAMSSFSGCNFGICGKTITGVKRNVLDSLLVTLISYGFQCNEKVSKNYVDITVNKVRNRFYLFGGKDEASASLIQGMTLGGILLDEIVLMPRSFVEQAIARCSLANSKLWFNCNPSNPYHWFYRDYIKKVKEKKLLYLHFTMDDNPTLSEEIKERYKQMFTGAFYDRFILGKWVSSNGLIYPMFDEKIHITDSIPECFRFIISGDYGTVNPCSFGLWGCSLEGKWFRIKEYYYNSRTEGISRTDEEHYAALEELAGDFKIEQVIIDPSAASFIECIRRHGKFEVRKAQNDVVSGIRRVSDALKNKTIFFHSACADTFREFSLYQWNEKANGDVPVKENDHAMDDIRYFVTAVCDEVKNDFFCGILNR
jgi:PBSX family phage terminase large subunit